MPIDVSRLRVEIQKVSGEVERLAYSRAARAELPAALTASCAGVGNPLPLGLPAQDHIVVDIGAGSGLDGFLAARAVGPSGRVIAVDMTGAVLERGLENAALTGFPGWGTGAAARRLCLSILAARISSSRTTSSTCRRTRTPCSGRPFAS